MNSSDKCRLFETIDTDFVNKKYTLREFPNNIEKADISLNRCAHEGLGFLPEKFKLGNPTPGGENDCMGPNFILGDIIVSIIPPVHTQIHGIIEHDYDDLEASCSDDLDCTSSIQESDFSQITTQGIEKALSISNSSSIRKYMHIIEFISRWWTYATNDY